MIAIETLLFGLLGGLIGLKVALLAAAAVLLVYGLTVHTRQRKVTSAPVPVRQRRLDVRA